MKKLITIIVAIIALSIVAIATDAAPAKPKVKRNKKPVYKKSYKNSHKYNNGLYRGHYNRRGVYIYTTTRIVSKWNGKYKNTYKHRIFPNGRHKVKLIKSVRIRHAYPVRIKFKSKIVYFGWRKYRLVYKITKFSNGRIKRVVHKKRRVW